MGGLLHLRRGPDSRPESHQPEHARHVRPGPDPVRPEGVQRRSESQDGRRVS